ncbi:MAG TPA: exopolysaccharide biosynthesis polyprenyl glycosylphosphotransferase [Gaiellaceae bacterium]|nr:exopolysaccharide biosynthesis polyprenyl glycosylphosphotransferase [Gaiellaceae bacterium]
MAAGVAAATLDAVDERTRELVLQRRRGALRRRGYVVRRALLAADLAGLVLAFAVSQALFGSAGRLGTAAELAVFAATLPVWVVAAQAYGLYERDEERTDHSTAEDLSGVFHLLTVGSWLLYAFVSVTHAAHPSWQRQLAFWSLGLAAVAGLRVLARVSARRSPAYLQNTVVVGAGNVGQLVARKVLAHREYGLNLVGFVDHEPREWKPGLEHVAVLGTVEMLPRIVEQFDVERVIFTFANTPSRELVALVRDLRDRDVQIDVVPRMYEITGPAVDVHDIEGLPLLALRPSRRRRSARAAKRVADVVVSLVLLTLFAPLLCWIAWRVRRSSPGPVLFRQERLGEGRRPFTCLKFRTMRADTDPSVHEDYLRRALAGEETPERHGLFKLEQPDAVTPFGRFLRRTSLDELPQLLNVLRGEMSLVGPRPCLPYEAERFEPHHHERFDVPAGITGLWQVSARAKATFLEALEMDVTYARNWSLWLDLRLLLRTPAQLLRPKSTS